MKSLRSARDTRPAAQGKNGKRPKREYKSPVPKPLAQGQVYLDRAQAAAYIGTSYRRMSVPPSRDFRAPGSLKAKHRWHVRDLDTYTPDDHAGTPEPEHRA